MNADRDPGDESPLIEKKGGWKMIWSEYILSLGHEATGFMIIVGALFIFMFVGARFHRYDET